MIFQRKFYKGEITLEEAFYQIKHLKRNVYPWWLKDICIILGVAFFTGMFGGNWQDMFYTGIVGTMSCRMAAYWKSN